ncbi:FAD-dependent oxidoreductase [Ectothiorhodospiraceae bacterium WFHF3C12]|nr:FAD-dependent oxidoreductase [Ectothiorhodospiraceae bacterium WFHF3C12]
MTHIVIIGGGIGGIPAAYELREALGSAVKITVINRSEHFQFVPSNPWLAVGWRERDAISFPIAPHLRKRNIDFVASPVSDIDPKARQVRTESGEALDYDYLVITTGPELAFDQVPGAGPDEGFTQSICTADHADRARVAYETFLESPGPIVVGALQGASCYGPAYEFAMILDADLRKRGVRDRVPMTFVTPEPYIGHLGLGGVEDSKGLLESELRKREIKWITNAETTRVEHGKMFVSEHDDNGEVRREHELAFDFSMMLPAFRGVKPVAAVDGLCNPKGFVLVDEYQRSPEYPEIYSAGVCIAIPPVEQTPVPTGAPKTGYMIESMVTAIVQNIRADLAGEPLQSKGTWNAICLADLGNTGVAFVALPQNPPRNVTWARKGKWVHLAKIAFEKYFIRKMKKGRTEPVYEKYVLRALGINRLKARGERAA